MTTVTPKADDSIDKLRECDNDKAGGGGRVACTILSRLGSNNLADVGELSGGDRCELPFMRQTPRMPFSVGIGSGERERESGGRRERCGCGAAILWLRACAWVGAKLHETRRLSILGG